MKKYECENVLIVHDGLPFFNQKIHLQRLPKAHIKQPPWATRISCWSDCLPRTTSLKYILIESPTQDSSGKSVGLVRDPQTKKKKRSPWLATSDCNLGGDCILGWGVRSQVYRLVVWMFYCFMISYYVHPGFVACHKPKKTTKSCFLVGGFNPSEKW